MQIRFASCAFLTCCRIVNYYTVLFLKYDLKKSLGFSASCIYCLPFKTKVFAVLGLGKSSYGCVSFLLACGI